MCIIAILLSLQYKKLYLVSILPHQKVILLYPLTLEISFSIACLKGECCLYLIYDIAHISFDMKAFQFLCTLHVISCLPRGRRKNAIHALTHLFDECFHMILAWNSCEILLQSYDKNLSLVTKDENFLLGMMDTHLSSFHLFQEKRKRKKWQWKIGGEDNNITCLTSLASICLFILFVDVN